MRRYLRLDTFYFSNIHTFTLVNKYIISNETLTILALLIYGVYNTTNALRAKDRQQESYDSIYAYDMLVQNIENSAQGHPYSTYVLDHRWARGHKACSNNTNTPTPDNRAIYNYTINMG